MARSLFANEFGLIHELGPSRRQGQRRRRWLAIAIAVGVTGLIAFAGQVMDRNDAAARGQAAGVTLISPVAR